MGGFRGELVGNITYLSIFHVLWHVLKYQQLAAFCTVITGGIIALSK